MSNLVGPGSKYDDEVRRRAVVEFAVCGVVSKVAERIGVPRRTVSDWSHQAWWGSMLAEVRQENEAKILAGNERIIRLAHQELEDRLVRGDVVLSRTRDGIAERRVPVRAKDLSIIAGVSFDKRRLSLNLPTSITSKSDSIKELEQKFRELAANHKRIENSVVDEQ